MTNIPQSIIRKIHRNIYQDRNHPLGILKDLISNQLPDFELIDYQSPIVSTFENFDQLGFPLDHPGRRRGDSYYLNSDLMLRTHTSAHEVQTFATGKQKWLIAADVYRRDEIDSSHFPVFHQMEGASVLPRGQVEQFTDSTAELKYRLAHQNIKIQDRTDSNDPSNPYQAAHDPYQAQLVVENLKATINSLIYGLFINNVQTPNESSDQSLQVRWIPAYFPFTSPSYEVEVFYRGKWLEILGCGVVQQRTLDEAQVPGKMGWAFGLGLERIAMVLFSISDIRLFWSDDPRFKDQFKEGQISRFVPFSKNPACYKDLSFWIPNQSHAPHDEDAFEPNDLFEIIRDVGGSWVEEVKLIDEFTHPVTKRKSQCYRISYRSIERNLSNQEVNETQTRVKLALEGQLGLEFR